MNMQYLNKKTILTESEKIGFQASIDSITKNLSEALPDFLINYKNFIIQGSVDKSIKRLDALPILKEYKVENYFAGRKTEIPETLQDDFKKLAQLLNLVH